ncbi:metal-sulfur cluster assembly factor [Skermanella sp. TT6]|uniref:Metal-sulfur cluster assembly factor n=1 Tax=Skermanella cutis TaxID=2775420 RepID=A0ABX7BBF4_9PROT|nr:metal-sulfur cluster assembly factor [Skermanella sp. TT6]QQP91719.1 metal-sulfur cluster assembly factor [Skermanella sp. TT6]
MTTDIPTSSETPVAAAWRALNRVFDPETDLSVVEMGLVYGVEDTEDGLRVLLSLTHPSCPMGGLIVERAEAALADIAATGRPARIELTFEPPWTPDRITEEGRRRLAGER